MNSSDQHSKLPAWIFIATDLALIGTGVALAVLSPQPLSSNTIYAIVICVSLGALAGLVPLVVFYERRKNEMLDDRQRALEALSRTVSSSAEQISIAANGLHEIAELALKNLRMAEHLPHKLQDKIAEFQAQVAIASDAEKEELERELLALRTTESERLEAVAQRIAKSSAEWTRLEATTQQHLTAATEAVGQLAHGAAQALTHAQAAAEKALTHARVESARTMGEAAGKAAQTVETARAAALAELDARLAAATTVIVERVTQELSRRLATLPASVASPASAIHAAVPPAPDSIRSETTHPPPPLPIDAPPAATPAGSPASPLTSQTSASDVPAEPAPVASSAPKRTRRPRREEPPASPDSAVPAADEVAVPGPISEPAPVAITNIPEITPVAPLTAEPFTGHIARLPNGQPPSAAASSDPAAPDAAKSARRRSARKVEDDSPGLGLDLEDAGGFAPGRPGERVLTSDGATRLIATAYIGIGNRLFIRGEGPGLSWERGVPLQFVSIGKWRWETNDATAPVQFKLYKNDEIECAALGAQSLDPGYQQEVAATF